MMHITCCLLYILIGLICSTIMLLFSYKNKGEYDYISVEMKVISSICVLFWFIIFPLFIFYKLVSWWFDIVEDYLRSKNNG
jgi:hypothetical protein